MNNDNEPPIIEIPNALHPDFGDTESMINMREWLETAIKAKGAEITGVGMGMSEADLSFTLEGYPFSVNIKAL